MVVVTPRPKAATRPPRAIPRSASSSATRRRSPSAPGRCGYLIIAQDTAGFFAFSAICTHQGCPVDPPASDGSTFCPCHGSQFDGNGNVIVGPAFTPLPHYAVNICNGSVYVDTSTRVALSTRTPPA